jgi:hypothetical protein
MVTADRSAPLRRVGSLLGLLGLEVAAVAGLHWLGRLPALQIPWERPLPWLLDSPVQEVLGSLARMVGLVMAYWLLASSLLYLLASLSQLPAAVRAVRWLTLPLVRRVADHAVAVTLATSMVGGGTLASAGPAGAAPSRGGGVGPPGHRGPVAAAPAPAPTRRWAATAPGAGQPTSTTGQEEEPASPRYRPTPAGQEPTTTRAATGDTDGAGSGPPGGAAGQATSTTLRPPAYRFNPADTTTSTTSTTTTTSTTSTTSTTTTTTSTTTPTTTAPTTTAPTTTAPTTTAPTTTAPTTTAPTTTAPTTTAAPTTRAATGGTESGPPGGAAGQSTSTTARQPAYRFNPAGTTTTTAPPPPKAKQPPGQPPNEPGPGSKSGSEEPGGGEQVARHPVVRGDNLWTIARNHLAEVRNRPTAELSDREIAAYWVMVMKENRGRLRSRDPDLIYPGEVVELPDPGSGS